MKRPRTLPTQQQQPQPLAREKLANIRGGHATLDPIAGCFANFTNRDPVAADQQ